MHIDKSQFNIVNYLFIWQSRRFGFNLPINVWLCFFSAYLECASGLEGVVVAEEEGEWGWRYHTGKGSPFVLLPRL